MSAPARPMLLMDVDGVVSLFGFDHADPPGGFPVAVDGMPHWLSASAGARLARLARTFECVWCSGWEERAEEHLPRLLGLPGGWAHVAFDAARATAGSRAHWKLAAIEAHAGEHRPLAWVDDALDEACDEWARCRSAPTLLVRTNPAVGLTDAHVSELEAWAAAVSSSS